MKVAALFPSVLFVLLFLVLPRPTMSKDECVSQEEEGAAAPPISASVLADELPIALVGNAERLSKWLGENLSFMVGVKFVTTTEVSKSFNWDFRTMNLLQEEPLPTVEKGGDIVLAERVLSGKVSGVIHFVDPTPASTPSPDINVLVRACAIANVPLALNEATADMALRGLAKSRSAYLIFNPVAGQGDSNAELEIIKNILDPRMDLTVILTQRDVDPADQAREVVKLIKARPPSESGSPAVLIASGGDGTVSAIAGATMGTGVPFAVIPRGTANAFSVALGIPTDLRAACRNILAGNVRVVDGAMVNPGETPMILLAGLGFEAGMVDRADRELKDKIGTLAYVLGGVQQFFAQEPFKCTLEIDSAAETQTLDVGAITVANVAPPTSVLAQGFGEVIPDDGLLDITIGMANDLASGLDAMASLAAAAIVKAPTKTDSLLNMRVKKLKITCEPSQKIVIDGEMLELEGTMSFEVMPGALRVVAPPATA